MILNSKAVFSALCVLLTFTSNGEGRPSSSSRALQCSTEQYRPSYHFSPATNWLNDPNGMVWYDGVYHLFFQYHPYSTIWGPMHWGHAISSNMVTWEELPIALYPDEFGDIFSGSAVVDFTNTSGFQPPQGGDPPIVAIYTSAAGPVQRQSIAYSLDKGMTFQKYEHNPVLADETRPDFRDPKVALIDGRWIMSLAVGDKIEFFSSTNLIDWTLDSEFGANPPEGNHGGVWECPDLFSFDVQDPDGSTRTLWVLIVSINPGGPNRGSASQYFVGNFTRNGDTYSFSTYPWSSNQWLDWGPDNYAGVTFSNEPQGRHIYMGWMNNWIYANNLPTVTWRGQMTLPRQMNLKALDPNNVNDPRYRVTSTPVPELDSLRNPDQHLEITEPINIEPQTVITVTDLANFSTPLMELEVTVEIEGQIQDFSICAFNSAEEESCFGYNNTRHGWYLDRSKSGNVGFHNEFQQTLNALATREVNTEQVVIRMFVDVSSLEVFADEGLTSMTSLHYPSQPFDKIYINNWSSGESNAVLRISKLNLWGLNCWYEGTA
nr:putative GH32 family protein [Sinella curviseta]